MRTIIHTPCSPPRMRSPRPFHRLNLVRVVRSPSSRTLWAPQEMTRRSKEESTPRGFRHLGQDHYHATRPHDRDWADGRTIVMAGHKRRRAAGSRRLPVEGPKLPIIPKRWRAWQRNETALHEGTHAHGHARER